jgi:cytochrome c2
LWDRISGVVGRPIASVADAHTPKIYLNVRLKNPISYVPCTMMTFAGLKSDQDRKDVIDYLESLKAQSSALR